MIAEPVPSRRVRFISIHADHDVAVPEDLYDGGHADGGKVERIHGFQLLPCFESPRWLPVLWEHVRGGVSIQVRLHQTPCDTGIQGIALKKSNIYLASYSPVDAIWCPTFLAHPTG